MMASKHAMCHVLSSDCYGSNPGCCACRLDGKWANWLSMSGADVKRESYNDIAWLLTLAFNKAA